MKLTVFNSWRNKWKSSLTILLILLMFVAGYAGLNSYKRGGLEFRFNQFNQTLNHQIFANQRNRLCIEELPHLAYAKYCLLEKPGKPTIVIMGDSHAFQYHHSLIEQFPSENILTIGESACLPFTGSSSNVPKHCEALSKDVLNYLTNENSIKKIYIAGYWSYLKTNVLGAKGPTDPSQYEKIKFEENARSILLNLARTGKETIVVLDNPHWWNINPRDCLFKRKILLNQKLAERCSAIKDTFVAEDEEIISIVNTLRNNHQNINMLDSKDYLCDKKICNVVIGNSEVYYDANHLTPIGSKLISFDKK